MSAAEIELIRVAVDAYNRRDLDAMRETTHPEMEWLPAMSMAVEGDAYRGHDGLARYFEEMRTSWERLEVLPDEIRPHGDAYVSLGRVRARSTSGVDITQPFAFVAQFEGGQIKRLEAFLDHASALEAAGASEGSGAGSGSAG